MYQWDNDEQVEGRGSSIEASSAAKARMNRTASWALAALGTMCLMLLPGTAAATTFFFTPGTALVTATSGQSTVLSETLIPLSGAFVTFDATGDGQLVDFDITIPQTSVLGLDTPYGGYDEVVIESADLMPGVGFSNLFNTDVGGGVYTFLAGPIDIDGVYSASDSTARPPPTESTSPPAAALNLLSFSKCCAARSFCPPSVAMNRPLTPRSRPSPWLKIG